MTRQLESPEARRLAEVLATDDEVRARLPLRAVAEKVRRSGGALSEIIETVMLGYADRPALGERRPVTDPGAAPTPLDRLEPRFSTISYREAWTRARSISTAWRDPAATLLGAGEVICSLAAPSVEFAVLELATIATGAVSVPISPSAPVGQWLSVFRETRPRMLAVGVELLAAVVAAVPADLLPPTVVVLGGSRPAEVTGRAVAEVTTAGAAVHTLRDLDRRGRDLPQAPLARPAPGTDPLAQILYTSGSTGDPKGAIFLARLVAEEWRGAAQLPGPSIVLHHAPMSHVAGYITLRRCLAGGGTCYFIGRGDMSTLLEDLALVRPTELSVVPRVCEMIKDGFSSAVEARVGAGSSRADARAEVTVDIRNRVLGGRVVAAGNGSALLGDGLKAFMSDLLGIPLHDGFGITEVGGPIMLDGRILRPYVTDYKLVDVPELGYFGTDRPHPRGELLIKTTSLFPGYFGRPDLNAEIFDADGFYRTGDIMAETGPDRLRFVDRRNNVLKLPQAEFVTVSKVEDVLARSPLIEQVFVHGRSGRAYLVAVVVPSRHSRVSDPASLKAAIARSIRAQAAAELQSYEIPRDFVVELEPFSVDNGLLSELGKPLRRRLEQRYEADLDRLCTDIDGWQEAELTRLRHGADERPVLDTVLRAATAIVGGHPTGVVAGMRFTDLGGDSLSALGLSTLLAQVYGVDVPAGVIGGPATTLGDVADLVEAAARSDRATRPTARSLHGDGDTVAAADLTLDAFRGGGPPFAAPARTAAGTAPRTVLLTGANGFLGRFLALELLQRGDCEVICLVRGTDQGAARHRLEQAFDTGDPELLARFRALAADRLQVVAGDVDEPDLGAGEVTWRRLARTVDAIVHPAAMVNHLLPYDQLFGPNVRGTAAVARLALTSQLKKVVFLSTIGVVESTGGRLGEQDDVRVVDPVRSLSSAYASGYATSKWAGEVLLREAHGRFGLPVTVFRSGLILAHRRGRPGTRRRPRSVGYRSTSWPAAWCASGSPTTRARTGRSTRCTPIRTGPRWTGWWTG